MCPRGCSWEIEFRLASTWSQARRTYNFGCVHVVASNFRQNQNQTRYFQFRDPRISKSYYTDGVANCYPLIFICGFFEHFIPQNCGVRFNEIINVELSPHHNFLDRAISDVIYLKSTKIPINLHFRWNLCFKSHETENILFGIFKLSLSKSIYASVMH